jgi:hypothetical protein
MKKLFFSLMIFFTLFYVADAQIKQTENIVIITLDGLRWQEMFTGADSALINNPEYDRDIKTSKGKYWASTPEERRRKLFPFIWSVVNSLGQIRGNRIYESKVNVLNE